MEGPKSCQHHYNHHIRNHCGFVEAKSVEQMQKNNQKKYMDYSPLWTACKWQGLPVGIYTKEEF